MTAVALRIEMAQPDASFFAALDEKLSSAPNLLIGAPIVLDFERVPELADRDLLREVIGAIRAKGLLLFGVQNVTAQQRELAEAFGLIPLQIGRDAPLDKQRASAPQQSADAPSPEIKDPPRAPANRIINRPVRSGQMIVAENGDLTIVGSVASGAEVVAAGNIHIYGTLRGRAMAGARGDTSARIFCHRLEAELLAIAGLFQTSEKIGAEFRSHSVQIHLEDEKLCIERFE
jgi:septum site-determining protein MinC